VPNQHERKDWQLADLDAPMVDEGSALHDRLVLLGASGGKFGC